METPSVTGLDRRLFERSWRRIDMALQGQDVDLSPLAQCAEILESMGTDRKQFEERVDNHSRSILRRAVRRAFGMESTPNDSKTIEQIGEMLRIFQSPLAARVDDCRCVIRFCKYIGSTARIHS